MTTIPGSIPRFERLFREVASLDVDKEDLRRHEEFVNRKVHDLLVRAVAIAKANGRDVIQRVDVPLTKGLQERMHEFRKLDDGAPLRDVLAALTRHPPLELEYSDELEAELPAIAGALSVALAHSFKLIDPDLKNPQTAHWERAFGLFDLLI
jgi:histone H3/H4